MALTRTSLCVHVLVCLFGIGSWIDINGVWVELPIMVQHLPEGWDLGSYLVIIVQLANIGPLVITLITIFAASRVKESPIVYAILLIGAASCLLLAFFWRSTSVVSGVEHSTALLVLQFFLAFVDCTSSVVFLPFMSIFKEQYMTTYFIGEGLSGFLPSVVALCQGAGAVECVRVPLANISAVHTDSFNETVDLYSHQPRFLPPHFPVKIFFVFLFFMMLACFSAFVILNHHPFCNSEKVVSRAKDIKAGGHKSTSIDLKATFQLTNVSRQMDHYSESLPTSNLLNGHAEDSVPVKHPVKHSHKRRLSPVFNIPSLNLSRSVYFYFLVLTAWMNALSNAVLPSIQTYSCLPYGIKPYHLSVILARIANPLACCVAFVLPTKSISVITAGATAGSILSAYVIALASLSPDPFLKDDLAGDIILIAVWVLTILCLTYSKVSIATLFRREGRKALVWCGAATQIGSAFGAIIMFLLINVSKSFKSAKLCS